MKRKTCFLLSTVCMTLWVFGGWLEAAIPASERNALIALYNSTQGDGWTDNSGWKSPPLHTDGFAMPGTENEWIGITVTGDHVTEIVLMFNNLIGPIPPEIGDLSMLKRLGLMDNYTLSGSIPKEIGKLSQLEWFQASVNHLSGPLPKEIGDCKKLKELLLYGNTLSGEIPPELGNLPELETLMMGINLFTGGIPASFGNLTKLKTLDFYENRLDGGLPEGLGNLSNLTYLGLYWNALKGKIPSSLINLENTDIRLRCNALYTNDAALKAFLDNKSPGWDSAQTIAPSDVTVAMKPTHRLEVSWEPIPYSYDAGGYMVYYREQNDSTWTYAGITADKTVSSFYIDDIDKDNVYCVQVKTRTFPNNENENTVDSVFSHRACTAENGEPFGSFDTPVDGVTVIGSLAVTGWALDDQGVTEVKIYREPMKEYDKLYDDPLIYIGVADFVEGSRPDVEEAYPDFPNSNRAGWGYMMLTNCLPNNGNGTFRIHAIAYDEEGNGTTLGVKSIVCDNLNAVKPFGTIDTPGQGGEANGDRFVNFGWALTPMPNLIPLDGSTIGVWVDGVPLGHPVYNLYRADIATFFPGYANSNGAVGYFYLDTTAYTNGGHTIQWSVIDDAGNSAGIGSRYFHIQNPVSRSYSSDGWIKEAVSISPVPPDGSVPIVVKRGYGAKVLERDGGRLVSPDNDGVFHVEIEEIQRVQLFLNDSAEAPVKGDVWKGFEIAPDGISLRRLPVGSSLLAEDGVFCWQPCSGFLGQFRLVFVLMRDSVLVRRVDVMVLVLPGGSF